MSEPWWSRALRDSASDVTRLKSTEQTGLIVLVGERQYYLIGVERPPSYESLVATIRFHPQSATIDFTDKLDLQSTEDCEHFIASAAAEFEPAGYRLDPGVLRSDLEILRVEAERWREVLVEQSLKWWGTIPQA